MTADVWNALVDMMNVGQLDNFIETLEFAQDKFISNEVITNAVLTNYLKWKSIAVWQKQVLHVYGTVLPA